MKIGEFAKTFGLNPKTLRFYEDQELLPNPARTDSGYRDYGAEDQERLQFILQASTVISVGLWAARFAGALGGRPFQQITGRLGGRGPGLPRPRA